MQVRISTCIGALVTEESSEEVLGTLVDILIHPDTGKVEGFYVQVSGGFGGGVFFCGSADVSRFGTRVYVRRADVLCDPHDIVRLQALLEDGRTVLGQRVRTESGQYLGRCRDVQFDTDAMKVEWIFPKKFFRWRRGIAASDILEVRHDAIIVRDAPVPVLEKAEERTLVFDSLEVTEPSVSIVRSERRGERGSA